MTASNVSLKQLARFCRKLNLQPKSILAFQDGSVTPEGLDYLSKELPKLGVKDVLLMIVKDIDDIANLSEQQMNQYGWFHLPQLLKTMKMTEQKEEEVRETLPESDD